MRRSKRRNALLQTLRTTKTPTEADNNLAARHRAHDLEGLCPGSNLIGQGRVRGFMGQVPFTSVEPQERPALIGDVIANRSAQCGIARLESIDHCTLRYSPFDFEYNLTVNTSKRPQMVRKHDPNHDNVWTSTDSTDGRSRTIGAHESPESADAYTWPPVVPKYTPHGSSESTAIASRSTFT